MYLFILMYLKMYNYVIKEHNALVTALVTEK